MDLERQARLEDGGSRNGPRYDGGDQCQANSSGADGELVLVDRIDLVLT